MVMSRCVELQCWALWDGLSMLIPVEEGPLLMILQLLWIRTKKSWRVWGSGSVRNFVQICSFSALVCPCIRNLEDGWHHLFAVSVSCQGVCVYINAVERYIWRRRVARLAVLDCNAICLRTCSF